MKTHDLINERKDTNMIPSNKQNDSLIASRFHQLFIKFSIILKERERGEKHTLFDEAE